MFKGVASPLVGDEKTSWALPFEESGRFVQRVLARADSVKKIAHTTVLDELFTATVD